ncbi:RraA family protein [Agromyces albus]|uniref:RraA family protein n=1 Tax=Agromyces albus TaxID=205332 RepID=UPI00277D2A90|nr:RraA family protein [Agromyces albus]MDQ0576993.1 4-hydroxy-4-methyl-2-oxoglutarate aldolase [Agromyces albus]
MTENNTTAAQPNTPAAHISTAAAADALVRLGLPANTASSAFRPVIPGAHASGPAMPITHLGSVDVLLETIAEAPPGAIMVVDNGGRHDEACVGDLLTLEAKLAGLAGIVIWGCHRDTAQLVDIGLPVFSLGAYPRGPIRVPPAGPAMRTAIIDGIPVLRDDWVIADDDGILFVPGASADAVRESAASIIQTEQVQSQRMLDGASLREQIGFADYLAERAANPMYSLRDHLKARGGAVET